MTILLIDDDELGIFVRATVLRNEGYDVLTAASGNDGIDLFTRSSVDLVVLDFHLPDINGDTVLLRLKAQKPNIPVILLAGILGIQDWKDPLPDATIVKGEGPRVLLEAIMRLAAPQPS